MDCPLCEAVYVSKGCYMYCVCVPAVRFLSFMCPRVYRQPVCLIAWDRKHLPGADKSLKTQRLGDEIVVEITRRCAAVPQTRRRAQSCTKPSARRAASDCMLAHLGNPSAAFKLASSPHFAAAPSFDSSAEQRPLSPARFRPRPPLDPHHNGMSLRRLQPAAGAAAAPDAPAVSVVVERCFSFRESRPLRWCSRCRRAAER